MSELWAMVFSLTKTEHETQNRARNTKSDTRHKTERRITVMIVQRPASLFGLKMRTYGTGGLMIKFIFWNKIKGLKPSTLRLESVNIKAHNNRELARILNNYRRAERYLRHHQDEIDFPEYGLRYIAARHPTAIIFTVGDIKTYNFCYHFKGFLSDRKIIKAERHFGYRRI